MDVVHQKKTIEHHLLILSKVYGLKDGPKIILEYLVSLQNKDVIDNVHCERTELSPNTFTYRMTHNPNLEWHYIQVVFPFSPEPAAETLYG